MQNNAFKNPGESVETISACDRNFGIKENIRPSLRGLIVDDNDGVRECLSWALSAMGFEVSQASNGFEALGMFKPGAFDLVLTDLNMPGMDGWMLSQKVKQRSPETAVILLTGEEPRGVNQKKQDSCVDSVLFKPCRMDQIECTVSRLLDKAQASL